MAKKKTQAIIAQPGTPADGYTLDVKYDPENDDAFEAKAIFNDGTVRELGAGGSSDSLLITVYNNAGALSCDKSKDEIMEAVNSGVFLECVDTLIPGVPAVKYPLTYSEASVYTFCAVTVTADVSDPSTAYLNSVGYIFDLTSSSIVITEIFVNKVL